MGNGINAGPKCHVTNLFFESPERFTVSENRLEGDIPTEIGSLPVLRTLWLNDNKLSGAIPAALFNAASLESIGKLY